MLLDDNHIPVENVIEENNCPTLGQFWRFFTFRVDAIFADRRDIDVPVLH
jgi:hypothetical protein